MPVICDHIDCDRPATWTVTWEQTIWDDVPPVRQDTQECGTHALDTRYDAGCGFVVGIAARPAVRWS